MKIFSEIKGDLKSVLGNDPAAKSRIEVLVCHFPLHAIIAYRFCTRLNRIGIPILPRFFMMLMRVWSGVEIHPGATIGKNFLIDHGVGTVIGETAMIGDNCIIFQGVTLGGTGKHRGKRHPTLGDNVYVGCNSTLLGSITIGNNVKIGANTMVIMKDIPDDCTVVGVPVRIVRMNGTKVDIELKGVG